MMHLLMWLGLMCFWVSIVVPVWRDALKSQQDRRL